MIGRARSRAGIRAPISPDLGAGLQAAAISANANGTAPPIPAPVRIDGPSMSRGRRGRGPSGAEVSPTGVPTPGRVVPGPPATMPISTAPPLSSQPRFVAPSTAAVRPAAPAFAQTSTTIVPAGPGLPLNATARPSTPTSAAPRPPVASPVTPTAAASRQIAPQMAATPAVPQMVATPAVPRMAPTPAMPQMVATPAVPRMAPTPAMPQIAATPAVPQTAAKPAAPQIAATPAVPQTAAKPAAPQMAAKPAVPPMPVTPTVTPVTPTPVKPTAPTPSRDVQAGGDSQSKDEEYDKMRAAAASENAKLMDSLNQQMLALFKTIDPICRQEPGREGTPTEVISNMFECIVPESQIYHYDVEIYGASGSSQESASGGAKKYRCAQTLVNRNVIQQVSRKHALELGGCQLAYDGRRNVYSSKPLQIPAGHAFDVIISEEESERMFTVRFSLVKVVDMAMLSRIYSDKACTNANVQDAIQAADVILRSGPTVDFTPVGRSFFSDIGKESLGGGRDVHFGFYTSLRLGRWKPIVNIDMSATGFYAAVPLVEYIQMVLNGKNLSQGISDADRHMLEKDLKLVKVITVHDVRRVYRIDGFTRTGAMETEFSMDDKPVSVAQYFLEKYKIALQYPNLPCVECKKGKTLLPIEVCKIVAGQHCKRKLSDIQTANMIKYAATPPNDRFNRIKEAVSRLQNSAKPYLDEFGIQLASRPVLVKARVLPEPTMTYGVENGRPKTAMKRNGSWYVSRFMKPAEISRWAVVNFSSTKNTNVVVNAIGAGGSKLGMKFGQPVVQEMRGRNPKDALNHVRNTVNGCQLAVCILDKSTDYAELKYHAEVSDIVLSTQCVKQINVDKKLTNPKGATMFAENLLQKINTKMGGINNGILDSIKPKILNEKFICIGVDVTHPAPGDKSGLSVAAFVASMDFVPAQYYAVTSLQKNSQGQSVEQVVNTEDMFKECLLNFYKKTGEKPQHVFFYRDGVSEGQFDLVRKHELCAMRKTCLSLEPSYTPSITYIVVQKRHHVRFRNKVQEAVNVTPGLIVDTDIVSPSSFDFYLCSHAGIKGTSRPTHYHVLHDDAKLTPDEIYKVTYYLCHTYARCTRSVSVPAPAYYAHLAAFRAREHIKGSGKTRQASSNVNSEESSEDYNFADTSAAQKVNAGMRGRMYFV